MTGSSGPNGNWDRWLAVEIGSMKASIQATNFRIEDNRQSAFRELWLVRRELLGAIARSAPKRNQYQWMRHVPWLKIAALSILAILVVTGHVSGGDLKAWAVKKIMDF